MPRAVIGPFEPSIAAVPTAPARAGSGSRRGGGPARAAAAPPGRGPGHRAGAGDPVAAGLVVAGPLAAGRVRQLLDGVLGGGRRRPAAPAHVEVGYGVEG